MRFKTVKEKQTPYNVGRGKNEWLQKWDSNCSATNVSKMISG